MENKELTREELNNMSPEKLVETIISQREEIMAQQNEIKAQKDQIDIIEQKLDVLTDQIRAASLRQFGRSSEKDVLDGQMALAFNEAEATVTEETVEPDMDQVIPAHIRRRPKGKRDEDLKGIPARIEEHTLTEEKLNELFDGGYDRLEDEVYRKLDYHPAEFEVTEHHVAVYCGRKGHLIVRADHPAELLERSIATPSLAAGIMNAKYVNSIPLYRLEKEFERREMHLSRQVMAGWMMKLSERYLSLIYDRLCRDIRSHHVIHADETPVLVNRDGRKAGSKSCMWVYRSNVRDDRPAVVYRYCRTRNTDELKDFVNGFKGVIVSDGYASYHKLETDWPEDITVAGCWAHARRKFADIIKSASGSDKKKPKYTLSEYAVSQISNIYHLDNQLTDLSPDKRAKERNLTIRSSVEAFFVWAEEHRQDVTKGSNIGKALDYMLNQKKYLMAFLDDPDIPLDNNAAERSIRSFCVGKHNWHMIDTMNGAADSAMIYSIAETAKENSLKPYEYFRLLLEEIPKHMDDKGLEFLEDLLPWSEKVQETCKLEKRKTSE